MGLGEGGVWRQVCATLNCRAAGPGGVFCFGFGLDGGLLDCCLAGWEGGSCPSPCPLKTSACGGRRVHAAAEMLPNAVLLKATGPGSALISSAAAAAAATCFECMRSWRLHG